MPDKEENKYIEKMCDIMGDDLDTPACQEVMEYLEKNPNSKVYYDTVKKTVILCQNNDCPESLPEGVNERLMKRLNLDDIYDKYNGKNNKNNKE
jgi:hypothetical protein